MTHHSESFRDGSVPLQSRLAIGGFGVASLAVVFEFLSILFLSLSTGVLYHLVWYGEAGPVDNFAAIGCLTALCYTAPHLARDDYRLQNFLEQRRGWRRLVLIWNCAFLCLAMIGFLTKTTALFSRGWLVLFYLAGLVTVIAADAVVSMALKSAIERGRIARRRLMLVGPKDAIAKVSQRVGAVESGLRIVAEAALPERRSDAERDWSEAIGDAVAKARALRVEDVVIVTDWSRTGEINELVAAFGALPLSVHLSTGELVGRFANARIEHIGAATALALTAPPLGAVARAAKRAFDIVVGSLALLLLAPLLIGIALLIKTDSKGPIFFRQRRRGYNQQEFRIWKFRTMSTLDDGDVVVQARVGDSRVTGVGRYLRRFNLDELPQLLNVLSGEMSLVGPRPHAVAHDRHYETRIDAYPRRLNVKPGITGWAQVNGFRGATDTEAAMRARVEHDLYYIENWSLGLDLYIMLLTVVSPRAFRNAH